MSDFSAAPSMLGFLHQVRFALVLLLEHEDCSLRLEMLDDVDLTRNVSAFELLQVKHRAPAATLTDASSDLWKTLRVWATAVADGSVSADQTLFTLITTAQAPPDSAASCLRVSSRDLAAAHAKLVAVAATSTNDALKPAFEAFARLGAPLQAKLLSRIHIVDDAPNIQDARKQLEDRLSLAVARQYRTALADRVEGWWFNRSIEHLRRTRPTIVGYEVFDVVADLARQFQQDSLPIDFRSTEPSAEAAQLLEQRQFVHQLSCLGINTGRIRNAILDYYRAYAQRSQWARDRLLVGDELDQYEDRLRGEWDRLRLVLLDDLPAPVTEDSLKELGRDLLRWMETIADIRIRSQVAEPYVMRGSYHMLADSALPRVWWHPEFFSRIRHLVTGAAS